jgi:hypothetical protein
MEARVSTSPAFVVRAVRVEPLLWGLRNDPRIAALLNNLNLPAGLIGGCNQRERAITGKSVFKVHFSKIRAGCARDDLLARPRTTQFLERKINDSYRRPGRLPKAHLISSVRREVSVAEGPLTERVSAPGRFICGIL